MGLIGGDGRARLEAFLSRQSGGAARIEALTRLGGGAIQENWGLDLDIAGGAMKGRQDLVLRATAKQAVPDSRERAQEFALLRAAFEAGVTVPEPLWICRDESVIGRAFLVMRRIEGLADGPTIVHDERYAPLRSALAERLGEELARIHTLKPPRPDLAFLEMPEPDSARYAVARYRAYLDRDEEPRPVLEWGLRWLERHAPPPGEMVLCHRDFRTGNYLVDISRENRSGLGAILDWEFAGWGEPMEDVAWFCAKSWRFGADDRPAGGLDTRERFYAAYGRASGREVNPRSVLYWEVLANLRWAIVARHQTMRHLSGAEPSLDLAATGRRSAEMELEILKLTEAA